MMHVRQFVRQQVSQLVSLSRSISQSVWVNQSISRSVNHSISQSVNQSVSLSVGQSVKQSVSYKRLLYASNENFLLLMRCSRHSAGVIVSMYHAARLPFVLTFFEVNNTTRFEGKASWDDWGLHVLIIQRGNKLSQDKLQLWKELKKLELGLYPFFYLAHSPIMDC